MNVERSSDELNLESFRAVDGVEDLEAYVRALEAFDAIGQLRELKDIERTRTGIRVGCKVLDVGCGFGLETLRLAESVGPTGAAAGLDHSVVFIAEAKRRAGAAGLSIDYRVGDAVVLPYPDASFDGVRAERLLIYLERWMRVVGEMRRVTRPGGSMSFIEPEFGSTTVNLSDRGAVRRALAYEADNAVANSWLPGPLLAMLQSLGLSSISTDTRVLVLPQELAGDYFAGVGVRAWRGGVLSDQEFDAWRSEIAVLRANGRLFGLVGYFLFTARV